MVAGAAAVVDGVGPPEPLDETQAMMPIRTMSVIPRGRSRERCRRRRSWFFRSRSFRSAVRERGLGELDPGPELLTASIVETQRPILKHFG